MTPSLQLVRPRDQTTAPTAKSADVLFLQQAPYAQLKLSSSLQTSTYMLQDGPSPKFYSYLLVAMAHVVVLAWMMDVSTQAMVVTRAPTPMTVSLVANPAPELIIPVAEPSPPTPAPPKALQPKKPTPKAPVANPVVNKSVVITPAVNTVVQPQPVIAEAAASETQPTSTESASTIIATSGANTASAVSAPAEAPPTVEPPRFGAAYLHNPAPNYPALSRRLGEEGRALLRVLVAENGRAQSVALETSSGFNRLDSAAIAAVKGWEFVPAKRDRDNISAYVLVPIKFSLTN